MLLLLECWEGCGLWVLVGWCRGLWYVTDKGWNLCRRLIEVVRFGSDHILEVSQAGICYAIVHK